MLGMNERGSKTKRYHYSEYLENKRLRYKCNYCDKTYSDNLDQLKNHFEKHYVKNETNINFPHSPKRAKNKSSARSSLNPNLNTNLIPNANLNANTNLTSNVNLNSNLPSNTNLHSNSNINQNSASWSWNEEKQSQAEKLLTESLFDPSCGNTLDLMESNLFFNFLKVLNPHFELPSRDKVLLQKIQDLENNQALQFSTSQNHQQQLDKLVSEVEEIKRLLQTRVCPGGHGDDAGDAVVVQKERPSTSLESGLISGLAEIHSDRGSDLPPLDTSTHLSDKSVTENTIVENNERVIDITDNEGLTDTQSTLNLNVDINANVNSEAVSDRSPNSDNNSDKNTALASDTNANMPADITIDNNSDKPTKPNNSLYLSSMVYSFQVAQAKTKRPTTKSLQQANPKKMKTQEVVVQGTENQVFQQQPKVFQVQANVMPYTSFQPFTIHPSQLQPPSPIMGTAQPLYPQAISPPNFLNQKK